MAWLAPVSPDIVWFRGEDTVRFLNDILSQEIGDMDDGEVRRSMLLTPDGKVQHLMWVLSSGGDIALITDDGRGEELANVLGRYRIRVDVTIEPENEPAWLVIGEWEGIDVSWPSVPRFLVIGDRPDLAEGTVQEYERLRIEQGEPLAGVDVSEKTIPQETGMVAAMVDFDKGCFVGQELVGRIDARGGNVPRPLRILRLEGEVSPGAQVMYGDAEVGSVTSVAGDLALGIVKRAVPVGAVVRVGEVQATVAGLPRNTEE
ncbi:MAG: hypothetical protein R3258_09455 [Acidimicrobiia bacterium]|nr:hypothetical protein [Acidimicrobiia bacterium]